MVVFQGCLFAFILCLRGSSANDNTWTAEVPKTVTGVSSSCVVIPCSFNYPKDGKTHTEFTGIWYRDKSDIIYHTEASKIISEFKHRTSLLGDLRHKNCTLKISSLHNSDAGEYMFRIEIKDFNKFTYTMNSVSITVKDSPEKPTVSVEEEMTSKKKVTTTCVTSHSCPSDPPRITWSHDGTTTSQSQAQEHGQWKLTSSLTFTPSREDHHKPLICSVEFSGGKKVTNYKTLNVKYPPYNVSVESKSPVRENGSAELTCVSDSYPPANSFQWFSFNKTLLANEPTYRLNHVTRHTEAISCTASNTEGENSSGPQKLNVLYPPEITNGSFCKSELFTVCVCIVDSNPPSEVKWFGPSRVFPSSSVEHNGSLITYTLEGWLGFPSTVHCSASNSEGNSAITFQVSHGSIMYLAVATPAVVIILVVISVCVAKRHRGHRAKQQLALDMKNDQNKMKTPKSCLESKERAGGEIYTNYQDDQHVYKNWGSDESQRTCENDEDDSVYANM